MTPAEEAAAIAEQVGDDLMAERGSVTGTERRAARMGAEQALALAEPSPIEVVLVGSRALGVPMHVAAGERWLVEFREAGTLTWTAPVVAEPGT